MWHMSFCLIIDIMTGEELRCIRHELGMTGKEAAEFTGVSIRTWYRYEKQKSVNNAEIKLLEIKYKQFLGVNIANE